MNTFGWGIWKKVPQVPLDPPPLPDEAYADEFRTADVIPLRAIDGQAEGRTSQWRCVADLDGKPVPERQWLVHGLIPGRNVTLLSGDGGTGKSLLSMQLAVAVALGSAWVGQAVQAGKALYLSAEDDEDELHRRLADIVQAEGVGFGDLDNLTIRSLAGEDALFAHLDKTGRLVPSSLYAEIDQRMGIENPCVMFSDTLADLNPGNENDRALARQFIGLLKRLALRHDCAVVLLAHPSLTGMANGTGLSGNTAWNNSVRSRLYLERITTDGHEADTDARVLRTMKSNYGPKGGEINLRWQNGVFVAPATTTGLDRQAQGAKAERVFLRLLRDLLEQGRYVSATPCITYAPTVFAAHPKAEGVTRHAFATAMNILFDRGQIMVATHGKGAKARNHIAPKGGHYDV